MSNEIVKVQFLDREIAARSIEGDLWFTAREVAEMLEVEGGHRVVLNLFNDHKAEFLESESTVMRIMTVDGKSRRARLFSAKAVDLLAVLARSPRGVEVRRWCVDLRERLRSGESAEITREQWDAMRAEFAALKAERDHLRLERGNAQVDLRLALEANAGMSKLASQVLTIRKREKSHEREVELFADRPSLFAGAPLTEIDERVIAALHLHGPFDSVGALAKHLRMGVARLGDSISTLAARRAIERRDGRIALVPQPVAPSERASA